MPQRIWDHVLTGPDIPLVADAVTLARRIALVTKGMNDKRAGLIVSDIHHKV